MSGEDGALTDEVRQNIATLATRVAILELGQEATMKALADIKNEAASARGEQKEWRHQISAQMSALISAADEQRGEERAQARIYGFARMALPFMAGVLLFAAAEWIDAIAKGNVP